MIKPATTPSEAIKSIKSESWYRLADIVQGRWIINTVGKSSKRYLYRLIKSGRLLARNRGIGVSQPLYMVLGDDIINFIRKNYL
jgi:hypothetical protein